jgi:CBS-domain-containing membrane protein
MFDYFKKMRGGAALPPAPAPNHVLWSWVGGAVAIGLIAFLTTAVGRPILMAPLGASAVLAFGVPDSPLAQPRNIVGGHVLTAFIGLVFLEAFGADWWSMGGAVATAIAAMQVTRTVHPPAGANPLLIMVLGASWDFLFIPVLAGSMILAACAVVFNNLAENRRYPLYWS